MAYIFKEPINPENPTDISDPPPSGWEDISTHDYRVALFSCPSHHFTECIEWEKRELKRCQATQ